MSNSRRIRRKVNNSTKVLIGRFAAEVREQGVGGYSGTVEHDPGCPGLRHQSILKCTCKPKITIRKVA